MVYVVDVDDYVVATHLALAWEHASMLVILNGCDDVVVIGYLLGWRAELSVDF